MFQKCSSKLPSVWLGHLIKHKPSISEEYACTYVQTKLGVNIHDLCLQEKDRAMDLTDASVFAEEMCNELVSISSAMEKPATILQATDKQGAPFLDVLINCELKQV